MFEESVSSVPSIWATMNSWLTPTVLFLFLNLMIGTIAITSSLATNKPGHEQQQQQQQQQHQPYHHHQPQQQNQLSRSPSVLQRLKSINFYSYRSQESTTFALEKPQEFDHHFSTLQQDSHQHQRPLSRSPSILQKLKSINIYNYLSPEPITKESTIAQQINDELKQRREQGAEQKVEEEEKREKNDEGIQDQEPTLDEIYSKLQSENKVSKSTSDTKRTSGEVPTALTKKMTKSASLKSAFAHFEDDDIVESRRPATVREKKSAVMAEVDDAEVDAKADDFINRFKQQLKLQRIDSIIRQKKEGKQGK